MKIRRGFTIVETTLAMVFVGLMMIAIAVLVQNIGETYAKGITIKNVNEVARSIIDDLERSISASPTFGVVDVNATDYTESGAGVGSYKCEKYDGATCIVNYDATIYYNAIARRFCTGAASYIWNTRDNLERGSVSYGEGGVGNNVWDEHDEVRLVKVQDYSRRYCLPVNTYGDFLPISDADNPEELIDTAEENLVLYDFVVFENARKRNINPANGQVFYSGSFVLGSWGGVELSGLNPECVPPSETDIQVDWDMPEHYCSVNKFNFSQRAMGSSQ